MPKLSFLQKCAIALMLAFAAYFVFSMMTGHGAQSSDVMSLRNAKKLCTACRQYASNHQGNFPPSLDALFPDYLTDRSMLASPLMPGEPAGYTYTAGLKDTGPVNAVVIEDKFAPLKHHRIVAYVDGSARILDTP